jgi:hypothetical protein
MKKEHTSKTPPTSEQRREIFEAARHARAEVSRMSRSEKDALEATAHRYRQLFRFSNCTTTDF